MTPASCPGCGRVVVDALAADPRGVVYGCGGWAIDGEGRCGETIGRRPARVDQLEALEPADMVAILELADEVLEAIGVTITRARR